MRKEFDGGDTGVFRATLTDLRKSIDEDDLVFAALREGFFRMEVIAYIKDCRSFPGRYVVVSRAWERHHHLTRDQVLGRSDYDLMPQKVSDRRTLDEKAALDAGYALQVADLAGSEASNFKPLRTVLTPLRVGGHVDNYVIGVSIPTGWRS